MSAISGYISTIQNAVYGEQVRGAIINALEACYSDVENPDLQSAAFLEAIEEAYDSGILDITTVTQISSMTNQNIIYRYNGTQAGYQKGLYYYSPISSAWVLLGSEVHSVTLASQMTDTNSIYKYTGTETGMVQNSLYCYNGTAWVPIGSGVLLASTAAGMTNTGAIYKYTGNESGYVAGKLYYHNGTAWVILNPDPPAPTLPDDFKSAMMTFIRNMSGTFVDTNGAEVLEQLAITLGDSLYYQKDGRTLIIAEYSDVSRDGFSNGQLTLS